MRPKCGQEPIWNFEVVEPMCGHEPMNFEVVEPMCGQEPMDI